ncbi:MAG: hypothetical protein H7A51_03110 [Akkermansiaceae bacterium]|nr:hypothetical protein [Akkermansiaceae bacterium]
MSTIIYATYDYDEQIHRGIAKYGQSNGYAIRVIHPHNFHTLHNQGEIAGIVSSFMPENQESGMSQYLMDIGCPVVDLTLNYPAYEIPRYIPDLRTSAKLATGHLLSQGVKDLSYVGWGHSWHDDLRVKSYQASAKQRGRETKLCYFRHQKESRHTLMLKHLESLTLPAGIYVSYDRVGAELI